MAYILSEEAKDLLKDVTDFCDNELKEQLKEYDKSGEFPAELYAMAQEMQLHMLEVPEEYGGLGLDSITKAAILERMAYTDAGFAVTMGGNGLSLRSVLLAGTDEQKKKCCDILLNNGYGAFALTEPSAGCDASNSKSTAVREGDEYILNGRKCFITNAQVADYFVVTAMTDKSKGAKGMTAFLVYKGAKGLSVGAHEDKCGIRTSVTSDLVLEDVHVPVSDRLGEEGQGFAIAMATLDGARVSNAVMATGIAQRAIDEAAAYAKQRVQFGKPICKNQGIQFKLADMAMRTEAGRQLIVHALNMSDAGLPFSAEAAMAKCFAGDAVMQTTVDAVQIFGGYGYSREYPVEKLMRDAKIFAIFEGSNEIQRIVISRGVLGK